MLMFGGILGTLGVLLMFSSIIFGLLNMTAMVDMDEKTSSRGFKRHIYTMIGMATGIFFACTGLGFMAAGSLG